MWFSTLSSRAGKRASWGSTTAVPGAIRSPARVAGCFAETARLAPSRGNALCDSQVASGVKPIYHGFCEHHTNMRTARSLIIAAPATTAASASMQRAGPQSVGRIFTILDSIAGTRVGATLSDLARITDSPKTSLVGLLAGLCAEGCLVRDAAGRYCLGPRIHALSMRAMAGRELAELVRPVLAGLVEASGETAVLGALAPDADLAIYLDRVESSSSIRYAVTVGERRDLYCTAMGKALLAYFEPARLEIPEIHSAPEVHAHHHYRHRRSAGRTGARAQGWHRTHQWRAGERGQRAGGTDRGRRRHGGRRLADRRANGAHACQCEAQRTAAAAGGRRVHALSRRQPARSQIARCFQGSIEIERAARPWDH